MMFILLAVEQSISMWTDDILDWEYWIFAYYNRTTSPIAFKYANTNLKYTGQLQAEEHRVEHIC